MKFAYSGALRPRGRCVGPTYGFPCWSQSTHQTPVPEPEAVVPAAGAGRGDPHLSRSSLKFFLKRLRIKRRFVVLTSRVAVRCVGRRHQLLDAVIHEVQREELGEVRPLWIVTRKQDHLVPEDIGVELEVCVHLALDVSPLGVELVCLRSLRGVLAAVLELRRACHAVNLVKYADGQATPFRWTLVQRWPATSQEAEDPKGPVLDVRDRSPMEAVRHARNSR